MSTYVGFSQALKAFWILPSPIPPSLTVHRKVAAL